MLQHDPTSRHPTDRCASPDMAAASATQITPERIMQFTFGFAPPLIIEAAIRHRVFDVLDEGAKMIEQLCAETQTSLGGLPGKFDAAGGLEPAGKDHYGPFALTPQRPIFFGRSKAAISRTFFPITNEPMPSERAKLHDIIRSGRPEKHI